jgi:hypothetical protein
MSGMRDDLNEAIAKAFARQLMDAWDTEPKPVRLSVAQSMIEDAIGAALRAAHGSPPESVGGGW